MSNYRMRQEAARKKAFMDAERTAAELPLRNAEKKFAETANRLALAERQAAALELMNETCNKVIAERVKPFVPKNPPLSITELRAQIRTSHDTAVRNLARAGYVLLEPADLKVRRVLTLNSDRDFTTTENLQAIMEYMIETGALVEGTDVVFPAPEPVNDLHTQIVRPTAESLMAEVENSETTSYEGERLAKRRTHEAMVLEARPVVLEFFQFVESTYDIVLTEALKQKVINYCVERGSFSAAILNAARRDVLKCRTADEQTALMIEQCDKPLATHAVRVDLASRIRELQD